MHQPRPNVQILAGMDEDENGTRIHEKYSNSVILSLTGIPTARICLIHTAKFYKPMLQKERNFGIKGTSDVYRQPKLM